MPPSAPMNHPVLLEALAGIRRKVRTFSVLRGIGLVVAATIGLMLGVVLLDYLLNLPAFPRIVFLAMAAGAIVYIVWTCIARPLFARLSLGDVAGLIEGRFPQMEDHLRSTVDFVRGDIPGSDLMKDRTVARAQSLAGSVNLSDVLLPRPMLYSMGLGLAALVLAGLLGFAFTDFTRIALSRLLVVNAQDWPKRNQIELVSPIREKVAEGQRLDVRMKLVKGDRPNLKAIVYYQYDSGPVQQQIMTRGEDGTYSVAVDARGEQMKVWMKAGDDEIKPAIVSVVKRLAIRRVEAQITPPQYSKLEPVSYNLSQSPAVVTVGSDVQLTIHFSKPLAEGKPVMIEPVRTDAKLPMIAWQPVAGGTAIALWNATESLRFRIRAMDTDYFENPGLEEFDITVKPDQMPSVMIQLPRGHEDRTPESIVNLEALAEDDFEIATATLMVERLGDKKQWEIPLAQMERMDSRGQRQRFRIRHTWELKDLPDASLKPGDVLEYCVRVTDNYNLNGAVHDPVFSGKLRINVISQEQLAEQIAQSMRTIAERVRQATNAQNRTKQETENVRKEMSAKEQPDAGDRTALNRLTDQQSQLTSQTKQMAGQMSDLERRLEENRSTSEELKNLAKEVKNALQKTAESPMSEASKRLSDAQQHADPKAARGNPQEQKKQNEARNQAMETSEARQQEAADQLAKVQEKLANLNMFEQKIAEVRALLKAQQELSKKTQETGKQTIGKETDKLTPDEKKALDDIAKEQKTLADKTDQLTKDLQKASEQSQKSDPAAAEAMKKASQQSQQQQVSSQQSQASQAAQQNQQAQAQAKQKQAELGLQMMLDTLREAERRKLEQLRKELAKLQELVAALVIRQAGHNIDNLRIQGGEAQIKQISDELLAKAQRLRDSQPAVPRNDQIMLSQAQTETNTRDVAKTAEAAPKAGAEIAASLTKAASEMERATVNLKNTKLPDAYDPWQVKALASLEDAKRRVDEAAQEVQDQIDEADKETIRQAYEKIKADQERINAETARIDGSERMPDGSLTRADAVNVGKLPGQQGGLADATKKLEEGLSAAGGIVYVWANQDIVSSMNDIKGLLAKPDTGKPTQIEQKRIIDQLDAMIRNLATKPKKSDFHAGGGGGGGGGQPPKKPLPTEAELRLLKELQIAINNATKQQNAQPKPDKPRLVSLGGRQGEMRNLLDRLLQKASEGKVKLDPEPDPKDRLPEEAGVADVENQEFDEWLLGGKEGDEQMENDIKMVGQRMARSKQRLAMDHDPGKTTQIIQDRAIANLDHLIDMARQQQAQGSGQQQQGEKGQAQQAKGQNPGQQDVGVEEGKQPNKGSQAATAEQRGGSQDNTAQLLDLIAKGEQEWGKLTPRERQAVIDGIKHDRSVPKYKQLIDDYYEMLSKKGAKAD